MLHADTVQQPDPSCPKSFGRPVHPAVTAAEALVEALAAIDCDYEALEAIAHANIAIARQAHERALRLRNIVRPEIIAGYNAAEQIVAYQSSGYDINGSSPRR